MKKIYLDNAATSHFKPLNVKLSLLKSFFYLANPGRSGHKLSLMCALEVFKTRQIMAHHFGLEDENRVIFTKNCTEALNIAILGTLKKGDHVVTTTFEHNSVLRPLQHLKQKEIIDYTIATPKNGSFITLEDITPHIKPNTKLVCITHISNVTGNKNDVESIVLWCRQHNILTLVDMAQSAGHIQTNLKQIPCDYVAIAGHKGFFALPSVGVLLINQNSPIPSPIMFGGTGTNSQNLTQPQDLPESLESGTLMLSNIISLKEGVKFCDKNVKKNNQKVEKLTHYLYSQLSKIPNIKVYTHPSSKYGVISFNIKSKDSVEVAQILDQKYNICVRSGLHCAPLTHKYFGTEKQGMVRVSLNHKTTTHQLNKLIKALKQIEKQK